MVTTIKWGSNIFIFKQITVKIEISEIIIYLTDDVQFKSSLYVQSTILLNLDKSALCIHGNISLGIKSLLTT